MAGFASLKIHVLGVFVMAIHANGNQPVCGVAFITRQIRVSTGVVFYFLALLCVTGKAWSDQLTFQFYVKRGVRVGMAASAVFQFIVGLVTMTHATLRNGTGSQRGVFHMAVLAPYLGLVLGSLFLYCFRLLGVTIDTLSIGYWPGSLCHLCLAGRWLRRPNTCPLFTTNGADQSNYSNQTKHNAHRPHSRQAVEQSISPFSASHSYFSSKSSPTENPAAGAEGFSDQRC
jgi:hypothetical protein